MIPKDVALQGNRSLAVMQALAGRLMNAEIGDRFERMSDLQTEFGVGAGTIQSAIKGIEMLGGAALRRSGHQGSFIEALNLRQLWAMANRSPLVGAFPSFSAPEMRAARSLLRSRFAGSGIPMNSYEQSGAGMRIQAVVDKTADFTVISNGVVSRISDEKMAGLETFGFDDGSYYRDGSVVVLCRAGSDPYATASACRTGIDPESSDHYHMSLAEFGDLSTSESTGCHYLDIPKLIITGEIDRAVWHQIDSLVPLELVGLVTAPLRKPETQHLLRSCSRMVLVARAEDRFISTIGTEKAVAKPTDDKSS